MLERIRNSHVMTHPTTKKVAIGALYTAVGALAIFGTRMLVKRIGRREKIELEE
jgi:hypothetical protein